MDTFVFRYGFEEYKRLNKTLIHWHPNPVSDLVFSSEGTYLWSGGLEAVLVQWSLAQIGHKDFFPHLKSPIKYLSISPKNGFIAISFGDGGEFLY